MGNRKNDFSTVICEPRKKPRVYAGFLDGVPCKAPSPLSRLQRPRLWEAGQTHKTDRTGPRETGRAVGKTGRPGLLAGGQEQRPHCLRPHAVMKIPGPRWQKCWYTGKPLLSLLLLVKGTKPTSTFFWLMSGLGFLLSQ